MLYIILGQCQDGQIVQCGDSTEKAVYSSPDDLSDTFWD